MLYLVTMEVNVPSDTDQQHIAQLKAAEKEQAQQLQKSGEWRHLWRVVGRYANISIFDVDSHRRLHEILSNLPLAPYLKLEVTPITTHPSALQPED